MGLKHSPNLAHLVFGPVLKDGSSPYANSQDLLGPLRLKERIHAYSFFFFSLLERIELIPD